MKKSELKAVIKEVIQEATDKPKVKGFKPLKRGEQSDLIKLIYNDSKEIASMVVKTIYHGRGLTGYWWITLYEYNGQKYGIMNYSTAGAGPQTVFDIGTVDDALASQIVKNGEKVDKKTFAKNIAKYAPQDQIFAYKNDPEKRKKAAESVVLSLRFAIGNLDDFVDDKDFKAAYDLILKSIKVLQGVK